jgi:hypothetical protein
MRIKMKQLESFPFNRFLETLVLILLKTRDVIRPKYDTNGDFCINFTLQLGDYDQNCESFTLKQIQQTMKVGNVDHNYRFASISLETHGYLDKNYEYFRDFCSIMLQNYDFFAQIVIICNMKTKLSTNIS